MAVFEKVAATASRVSRLQQEAAVLRSVAHPGIVTLISVEADRLRLRRVNGCSLDQIGPVPLPLLAGWAAAVATVVADLHHLGYVHGSLRADHILIDQGGRPVLCGLGSARRSESEGDKAAAAGADVAGLVALITSRLGSSPVEVRLRRRLGRGRFDARTLAHRLVQWVPDAYVGPVPTDPAEPPSGRSGSASSADSGDLPEGGLDEPPGSSAPTLEPVPSRSEVTSPPAAATRRLARPLVGLTVFGLVVLVAVLVATSMESAGHHRAPVATNGRSPGRLVVAGPSGDYRLIVDPSEQPVVAVGRWGCGPARPAVLDQRSGTVWVFSAWPSAGSQTTGHLAGAVPGASNLAAQPARSGCDRLLVDRRSGGAVALEVGP
ncbi:MAG TPA: hypothetical protein VG435_02545 [Acidimicrobiales bacterium]|jgi:hypothetical protein|nr:hypothetical protein [Acidimicrobiales bacterium]